MGRNSSTTRRWLCWMSPRDSSRPFLLHATQSRHHCHRMVLDASGRNLPTSGLVLKPRRNPAFSSWTDDCTAHRRMLNEKRRLKEKIMKVQRTVLASAAIALLFATASHAQQVKTDYDRSADFSRYKTYSWERVQTKDP